MKVSLEQLQSLPTPRLAIEFHETLTDTAAVKPTVGELTLFASASGMRLTGRVQTLLRLNCDRCLSPYFQSTTIDIDERFAVGDLKEWETTPQRDKELCKAEHFVETLPSDNVLDITDVVYQAVTLATPAVCLCGDQCPGPPILSQSGRKASLTSSKDGSKGEKPIDPRWKNLKSLFPNGDSETKS